jgi:hypothetical protein
MDTDCTSSAPLSASETSTLRVSLLRTVASLLGSIRITRIRLLSKMFALMRRLSARCTMAAQEAVSLVRLVPALVRLAKFRTWSRYLLNSGFVLRLIC